MNQLDLFPTDLHMRCIDPASKKRRFYALSVQRTLFGEWALVREWGRMAAMRAMTSASQACGPHRMLTADVRSCRMRSIAIPAVNPCKTVETRIVKAISAQICGSLMNSIFPAA